MERNSSKSYVGLIISYVRLSKSYVGFIISYVGLTIMFYVLRTTYLLRRR